MDGSLWGVISAWSPIGALALIWATLLYVAGRIGVSVPISIRRGRFSFEGWSASKGQGLSLLGAHLIIMAVSISIQIAFGFNQVSIGFQITQPGPDVSSQDFAASMGNPYGVFVVLMVPLLVVLNILALGPTAAIAKRVDIEFE
jgi:hypothetical protein